MKQGIPIKKSFIFAISCVFALIGLHSCKSVESISGYYQYDTECVTVNSDGTHIVKTRGTGLNLEQATANALVNAVNDILFKGIRNGNSDCNQSPLISDPNAREKHSAYFREFYGENGAYRQFISLTEDKLPKKKLENKGKIVFEFLAAIDVEGLRKHLQNNRIIQ
ncbi:hypothetical protein [Sinomicrobium sp.]